MANVDNKWSSLFASYKEFNPHLPLAVSEEINSLWESRAKYSLIATIGSIALKAISAGTLAQFFGIMAIGGTLLFVASAVKYKIAQSECERLQRISNAKDKVFLILCHLNHYEEINIKKGKSLNELRDSTKEVLGNIKSVSMQAIQACEKESGFFDRVHRPSISEILKDNITLIFDQMIGDENKQSTLCANCRWDEGLAVSVCMLRRVRNDFPTPDHLKKIRNTKEEIVQIYAAAIAGAIRVIDIYTSESQYVEFHN